MSMTACATSHIPCSPTLHPAEVPLSTLEMFTSCRPSSQSRNWACTLAVGAEASSNGKYEIPSGRCRVEEGVGGRSTNLAVFGEPTKVISHPTASNLAVPTPPSSSAKSTFPISTSVTSNSSTGPPALAGTALSSVSRRRRYALKSRQDAMAADEPGTGRACRGVRRCKVKGWPVRKSLVRQGAWSSSDCASSSPLDSASTCPSRASPVAPATAPAASAFALAAAPAAPSSSSARLRFKDVDGGTSGPSAGRGGSRTSRVDWPFSPLEPTALSVAIAAILAVLAFVLLRSPPTSTSILSSKANARRDARPERAPSGRNPRMHGLGLSRCAISAAAKIAQPIRSHAPFPFWPRSRSLLLSSPPRLSPVVGRSSSTLLMVLPTSWTAQMSTTPLDDPSCALGNPSRTVFPPRHPTDSSRPSSSSLLDRFSSPLRSFSCPLPPSSYTAVSAAPTALLRTHRPARLAYRRRSPPHRPPQRLGAT